MNTKAVALQAAAVVIHVLDGMEVKTYEYFLRHLNGLIRGVYNGYVGGEFENILSDLVYGQLTQAYTAAWRDDGNDGPLPDYLQSSLDSMIQNQWDFIEKLYRDTVDARVDNTPIDPLLSRAELWAGQFDNAQNEAIRLIALETGGKLEWVEGDTSDKCPICLALNGIVAYAREWDELRVRPGNGPNPALSPINGGCGGWRCGCSLQTTTRRRTGNAYDEIIRITSGGA